MIETLSMIATPRAADIPFDRIVREREKQVLRTAFRILGNWADAEDVAQEAFVRLHRQGFRFDSEAAMGAWLYRVTVNLCFDRKRTVKPSQPLEEMHTGERSAEVRLLLEEQKQRLMVALSQLPVRERAAVVLREIEGLTTAEVAEILGSSEGTVRSQVSKALTHLRAILGKDER